MASQSIKVQSICRNIIAVGRNYTEHAKELGNPVPKGNPLVFGKPVSSIITEGEIQIPHGWKELHHEVELGVVVGKPGKFIKKENAMDYVLGYVLVLDMTARGIQEQLKKQGYPWLLAKGFDTSCPISDFIPKSAVSDVNNLNLKLTVNGDVKQNGNTKDMIFKLPDLLSYISSYFKLEYGDLILTGTPSGVSAVKHGDVIEASLDDIVKIKFPFRLKERNMFCKIQYKVASNIKFNKIFVVSLTKININF
ncbi:acylpyruvase mitochondrial-like [Brachionus plicatilis]|uniref:Oxaloacetate tautomerase FAHD1, mitochondrial n=1 Tax=Brachionus plicatilis TaxID=10195 RepID=A0A3M7R8T8_BRAPC|nr:acylpyruvase mitochondrial-like [Brachionus plicatilis]